MGSDCQVPHVQPLFPRFLSHIVQSRDLLLDRMGTGAAVLCAVHCVATPLLLVAFPLAVWLGEGAEPVLVGVSLGLSALALIRGTTLHRRRLPLGLLLIAGALLFLRGMVGEGLAERLLVVTAASLLVTAHVLNIRCRHQRLVTITRPAL